MLTKDLEMNLQKLRELFRLAIRDNKKPYLVSDVEADEFANDAQVEACRRARLLVDSTSNIAVVSVSIGDPLVPLDPRIISIRRARLSNRSVPLVKKTVREMDEKCPGWENSQWESTPSILVIDYDSTNAYLYPNPVESVDLVMTVVREPLNEMTHDEDEPEIPPRYHGSLVYWMKKRAYEIPDSDLFDANAAQKAEAEFIKEFGSESSAVNERWEFERYNDVGER